MTRTSWSILPIALLALACAQDEEARPAPDEMVQACTLIGCVSGLILDVGPEAGDSYRIVVRPTDTSLEPRTIDCTAADASCIRHHMLEDFLPEEVSVSLIAAGDSSEFRVRPEYVENQPNGPGCPPTCRQATVRVGYPESAGSEATP